MIPATSIYLWPNGPANLADGKNDHEPTLVPYFPLATDRSVSNAPPPLPVMIICPGGAYGRHASHEGEDYARWLVSQGIACFVLRYRLGIHGHRYPAALEDLVRAVRLVRHHAQSWNLDATRIGLMGSSAGAHLVSTLLVQHDAGIESAGDPVQEQSCRPSLGVLCYPLISMENSTHAESRRNLLGASPSQEMLGFLSTETRVTGQVPPCFLWHTASDPSVEVTHSLAFAGALSMAGVPFELHVYATGGHGLGLRTTHPWAESCIRWLRAQNFLSTVRSGQM